MVVRRSRRCGSARSRCRPTRSSRCATSSTATSSSPSDSPSRRGRAAHHARVSGSGKTVVTAAARAAARDPHTLRRRTPAAGVSPRRSRAGRGWMRGCTRRPPRRDVRALARCRAWLDRLAAVVDATFLRRTAADVQYWRSSPSPFLILDFEARDGAAYARSPSAAPRRTPGGGPRLLERQLQRREPARTMKEARTQLSVDRTSPLTPADTRLLRGEACRRCASSGAPAGNSRRCAPAPELWARFGGRPSRDQSRPRWWGGLRPDISAHAGGAAPGG